jgi:hypothetical protein
VRLSLSLAHGHEHHSRVKKGHLSSCTLTVAMCSCLTSSNPVPVLWYPVLFNGVNYRDWVPRMFLHIHGLHLWEFLTGELPYPPSTLAPPQSVISEKTTAAEKKRLIEDYDDRLDWSQCIMAKISTSSSFLLLKFVPPPLPEVLNTINVCWDVVGRNHWIK